MGIFPSIYSMIPNYQYPPTVLFKIARNMVSGQDSSFRSLAREFFKKQPDLLKIEGKEYIPELGPCVLTFNHYHRPGFHAWWLALAVASVIPQDIHWIATNELTFPNKWYRVIGRPASRGILRRFSKIYRFTGMPPMPPRPEDARERAHAVRKVLTYIKQHEHSFIGLAPEGSDHSDGTLSMPAKGLGRFCLLLASSGMQFTPIGIHESDGSLQLNFGPQYSLKIPANLPAKQRDQFASRKVMDHIAYLMPDHLRGDFG